MKNQFFLLKNKKIDYKKNTDFFIKLYHPCIYYKGIDFLTCRLKNNLNIYKKLDYLNITESERQNFDLYKQNYEEGKAIYKINDTYTISYYGLVFGNQLKIYNIRDNDNNLLIQIRLKQKTNKTNNNVIDNIEFKGLFLRFFRKDLDFFLDLFEIDKKEIGQVLLIDYCIDIRGVGVDDIINHERKKNKRVIKIEANKLIDENIINIYKYINDITKNLKKYKDDKQYYIFDGNEPVYKRYNSERNELKIYNKKLDILENHNKTRINGKSPFNSYINEKEKITRIELRKKSKGLKEIQTKKGPSIDYIFEYIESLFFNFLKRIYYIDMSLLDDNIKIKKYIKKINLDDLFEININEKIKRYKNMIQGCCNGFEELRGQKELFRFLHLIFDEELTKFTYSEKNNPFLISDNY